MPSELAKRFLRVVFPFAPSPTTLQKARVRHWCVGWMLLLFCLPGWTQQTSTVQVVVKDVKAAGISGVTIQVTPSGANAPSVKTKTNAVGQASISNLASGLYAIQALKKGFYPATQMVQVAAPAPVQISFQLSVAQTKTQTVTVTAQPVNPVSTGARPPAQIQGTTLKRLPVPGEEITDALPLVPGIVRTSDGRISVNGTRENENAMLVNRTDATDPATGDFAVNLPLDIVDEVKVYQAPFLAQFGQFTGGVTQVETRGGTDTWHYELNDFFPEPRFRSGSIMGFWGITPRIRVAGPLIAHKLYISEGANYNLDKQPLRGLPFPHNIRTTESKDSFTQLDWVLGPLDMATITANIAPSHVRNLGLDVFLPEPTAPDSRQKNYSYTFTERHAANSGGLLENTFSYERFRTDIWPNGTGPMILTSGGAQQNFFNTQQRSATRTAWSGDYNPHVYHWHGEHQVRVGAAVNFLTTRGEYLGNDVMVYRPDGTLTQRLQFNGGTGLNVNNLSWNSYLQDQWLVTPRLSFDLGTRYESETIADAVHFAPRLGFSWEALPSLVLRGGVGIFYDRLPLNVGAFQNYPTRTLTRYGTDGTTVLSTRTYQNVLTDFTQSRRPEEFLPGGDFNFLPYNLTWNIEAERRFGQAVLLSATYFRSHTRREFVIRPERDQLGNYAYSLSNSGTMRYQKFELTSRIHWPKDQLLNVSYIHSKGRGDLNDFNTFFGDLAQPLIRRNQYGPLPSDVPERMVLWGVFHLPQSTTISPVFDVHSGLPYSAIDANFNYVGQRNSHRFPAFLSLDLTVLHDTKFFNKYTIRWGFDLYNVTSHFNPQDVQNNIADPRYGAFLANQYRYFVPELDLIW